MLKSMLLIVSLNIGEQFLYLRRYDNELKTIFEGKSKSRDFFDDIKDEFPDHTLKAKERKFMCDDETFGYAKRLTEAQDLKSATFSKVTTIIFDEYAIEKNKRYYLPNERYDSCSVCLILLFVIALIFVSSS